MFFRECNIITSKLFYNRGNGINVIRGMRFFLSSNSQYQNNNYDIISSLLSCNNQNNSIENTYKILNDIALNSSHRSNHIRISYLNQERDRYDIKGLKLLGYVDNYDSQVPWIVIVGGKEPNSWSTINLSLYLAALFGFKPLEKYDVLIFPIQSPNLYIQKNESPTSLLEASLDLSKSNIISSTPNSNILNSFGSSNNNNKQNQYSNFNLYSHSNINNNNENNQNSNYNPSKTLILNDWLKKSKRKFKPLNLNFNSKNDYLIQSEHDHTVHNKSRIENQYFTQDNSQNNNINNPLPIQRNYLLELKNIPNFISSEKLYEISKDIQKDLKLFEKFRFVNNKTSNSKIINKFII